MEEDQETVELFVEEAGVTSPVLLDSDGGVYRSYDTTALGGYAPFPLQILIDRDGKIVYMARQYNADAVKAAIEAALE